MEAELADALKVNQGLEPAEDIAKTVVHILPR